MSDLYGCALWLLLQLQGFICNLKCNMFVAQIVIFKPNDFQTTKHKPFTFASQLCLDDFSLSQHLNHTHLVIYIYLLAAGFLKYNSQIFVA